MPPPGGLRTSLSFSMTARSGGPLQAAFQPSAGIFSPGLPLQPTQGQQEPRAVDFPVGYNTFITPRGGFGDIHSFASLRAFSNVELVRLAIETCKDQIERLDWKVKPRDGKKSGQADSRIGTLEKFFRKPDGRKPFAAWLRLLVDDLLVLDAPAIELVRDRGGKLIALRHVPGETIKLLVDENGDTPEAPVPAYQQIVKGTVWADLTTDDLIYAPRNPRPNHLYGFSPVEQIIVTINTAMRRQSAQLGYFTEGNVPAGILNTPAGWGADAIKTMQDAWDMRLEGQLPGKSKLQWVPADTKYQAFKESPLKDEFDEWLARVVCFAFSLPPTAFVKMMNRASGQQQAETADEEGTQQRKLWWKRIADDIIENEFGYDDLEWGWNDATDVQPLIQAQIDDLNLRNGSTFINEVRDQRGLNTVQGGDQPLLYLVTGPVPLAHAVEEALKPPEPPPAALAGHQPGAPPPTPGQEGEHPEQPADGEDGSENAHPPKVAPPEPASKLSKAALAGVSADRPLARRAAASATREVAKTLKATGDDVAAQVEAGLKLFGKVAPADDSSIGPTLAAQIAAELKLDGLDDLDLTNDLVSVGADSGELALAQVGADSTDDLVDQINARALAYAKRRAAEMVSVQGPENIVASTRSMIRSAIADGLEQNLGAAKIAESVQASTAFSADRAQLIAQTEIAKANSQGAMGGYRDAAALGITIRKAWQISNDAGCCDDCQGNADQGAIGIDEDFQSGDDTAPAHPNCRCVVVPIVVDDDPDADGDTAEED